MEKKHSFVAVLGEPNVGKSTLVNSIVNKKVSITSDKPQTTRRQIKGIVEINNTQIVFIDTPGFCKPKSALEKAISLNFKKAHRDADIVLFVMDASTKFHNSSFNFIEKIKDSNLQFSVVINKVDISNKENILILAKKLSQYKFIQNIFMISALNKDGLNELINFLEKSAIPGPWFYEENQSTDSSIDFRLSEITREKVFLKLEKELPYSIYVETEKIQESEKKATIFQSIVVIKNSHKGIVLGKNGDMIKWIREHAIKDMKPLLNNKKIELKLFVKVKEKWTEKMEHLKNAGITN